LLIEESIFCMQYVRLGNSDLEVSRLALGTMSISDLPTGQAIIHTALDHGVNFFDTADLYQRGENEKIVGQALKDHRQDIILATKVGNQWRPDGSGWDWNPRKAYLKSAVHDSLRRLQTDYIDLYQLHGGTIDDPWEEVVEAFEELQAEGYIRYYGISSIRHNVIRRYGKRTGIVSNMMQLSLLDRRPEEWALPFLEKEKVGVIVRGAIAKGLLAGKPPAAHLGHDQSTIQTMQNKLRQLGGDSYSMSDLALGYVLAQPAVATIAVGASHPRQLQETLGVLTKPALSEAELTALKNMSPKWYYEQHREEGGVSE
jgi:aryl-alcohol dehydrogenase-like predicted oxidoreductase